MANFSNTPRPAYVYDTATNEWVPVGVGAHSHNEIPKTVVDAKGDLIVGTAADEVNRLAVGSNGYTLVADSSTSTGLAYSPTFFAGKNKLINADFRFNQRNFTSVTTNATYGFDRWVLYCSGGTVTYTPQTFTAGTAPVTGYEATNYARIVTASQSAAGDYASLQQRIEDVRTFANQTVTVSFWAKAASGTPNIGIAFDQNFGSGGSGQVTTSPAVQTITSSWARYSFQVSIPSISGKTIGTGSYLALGILTSCGSTYIPPYPNVGIQNITVDIWGVQVEAGSTATQFQTATGTIQGELAACQRYYIKFDSGANYGALCTGAYWNTTDAYGDLQLPVAMRVSPSITTATDSLSTFVAGNARVSTVAPTIQNTILNNTRIQLKIVTAADTAGRGANIVTSQNKSIELSAEL